MLQSLSLETFHGAFKRLTLANRQAFIFSEALLALHGPVCRLMNHLASLWPYSIRDNFQATD